MKTFKRPAFTLARWVLAAGSLALISACSGGCGSCDVPAYHATLAPGATPTPVSTPTPVATVTPSPAPGVACSQGSGAIPLNAAAPFALLAGSTITNVGNTVVSYAPGAVTGSVDDDLIGIWPGTAITGFPPGVDASGTNAIYAAIYNTNTGPPQAAQSALTVAYGAAAAAAPTATFLGGQDLSQASSGVANCGPSGTAACGVGTLGSGVYKSPSSLFITAGNLTLDGGGNANSVFIFQMVKSLTTGSVGGEGNVNLINGANACNVYWQVGSSATIGATGGAPLAFYGNLLVSQSAAIYATTFTGRALASIGAVTIPVGTGSIITNPGGN